jgi:hypothetical protein
MARTCFLLSLPLCGWALGLAADKPKGKPSAPVVIPFDFESKFDDGVYGQTLGDMIWKKLGQRGGFVIPESMLEVREWCRQQRFLPGPDTPHAKMKTVVRQEQGGGIGIWGKVERVPGFNTDVYDLWINIVDFSAEPARTVYKKKVRTKAISEIPHVYIKEALNALYGKTEELAEAGPDSAAVKERWEKGQNLVHSFDKGRNAPLGWDPLPKHVSWVREQGIKNRIIRFTIPPDVAETTGVLYYSDFFAIEEGATYRFSCRWRTTGTAAKVFIKCYDDFEEPSRNKAAFRKQRREVYRSQQNLVGPANRWNTHIEDFTPTHTQFTPRWGRVMLYAYYPAGAVAWNDVVVKQIVPPPSQQIEKKRRPSLETKDRTTGGLP